jgi:hypothetical protein
MAISATTGKPVYLGTNGANGTTVTAPRTKVANPVTSAATGIPILTGIGIPAPTALNTDIYSGPNSANGTTATARLAVGSLNVNSVATGKAVYTSIYG